MKLLIFGDIQVHHSAEWSKPTKNGRTKLLDICSKTFTHLEEAAVRHDVQGIVCLGDVFEKNDQIDVRVLELVSHHMSRLSKIGFHHHLVCGNHGMYSKDPTVHADSIFDSYWTVHRKPTQTKIGFLDVMFIPYVDNVQKFIDNSTGTIFGHFNLNGAHFRPTMSAVSDGATVDRLGFFGHHHHPEVIHLAYVVGSPYHKNFNDSRVALPRGYVIYEDNLGSEPIINYYRNPHTYFFESIRGDNIDDILLQLSDFKNRDYDRTHFRIYCPQDLIKRLQPLVKGAEAVRFIPTKQQIDAINKRVLSSVLELDPSKVITNHVLKSKAAELSKRRLIKEGEALFGH